jgi:hypothetical protein
VNLSAEVTIFETNDFSNRAIPSAREDYTMIRVRVRVREGGTY